MSTTNLFTVFESLNKRLAKLRVFHETFIYDQIPELHLSISEIQNEIFKYPPNESIEAIEIVLDNISFLEKLGKGIVKYTMIKIIIEDEQGDNIEILADSDKEEEMRNRIYNLIISELGFYRISLEALKNILFKNIALWKSNSENDTKPQPVVIIDNDYSFPKLKSIKEVKLSKLNIAFLLHYLKHNDYIQFFDEKSISNIAGLLTGYSKNTIYQDCLRNIDFLKQDGVDHKKSSGIPDFKNLKDFKQVLLDIVKLIDNDIVAKTKLFK